MTGRQTRTLHTFCGILCNRSISRTDFEDNLMDLILHKELSTNLGHYIPMVKVGDMCNRWPL